MYNLILNFCQYDSDLSVFGSRFINAGVKKLYTKIISPTAGSSHGSNLDGEPTAGAGCNF